MVTIYDDKILIFYAYQCWLDGYAVGSLGHYYLEDHWEREFITPQNDLQNRERILKHILIRSILPQTCIDEICSDSSPEHGITVVCLIHSMRF